MPEIRQYPEALTLLPTDAFVIDRLKVGTMYINAGAEETAALGGPLTRCITYVVDGGGSVINTGVVGDLFVPFAVTIYAGTLLGDQSGSVTVDIWSAAYGAYPPTVANSITASAPLTFASATHGQNTSLTGWTTAIPAGNTLRFNVNSVTSITRLTIALTVL